MSSRHPTERDNRSEKSIMQRVQQMTEELNLIASNFNNRESIQAELDKEIDDINITLPRQFVRPKQIRPSIFQKITPLEKYKLRMRALAKDSVSESKTYRVFLNHQKKEASEREKLKVHKLGSSPPKINPYQQSLIKLGKVRESMDSCDSLV